MKNKHKISTAVLLLLIFIAFTVGIIEGIDSEEVDDLCDTDNNILYRVAGVWVCEDPDNLFGATNDTNETLRFNTLVGNCSGGQQMLGVDSNGNRVCVTDATSAGGLVPHELNGSNHTGNLSAQRVSKETGTTFLNQLLDSIIDALSTKLDNVNTSSNINDLFADDLTNDLTDDNVDTSELDALCAVNDRLLNRNDGTWVCLDYSSWDTDSTDDITDQTLINESELDNATIVRTGDLSYIGNCSGNNCDIGWGNLTSVPDGFADGIDDTGGSGGGTNDSIFFAKTTGNINAAFNTSVTNGISGYEAGNDYCNKNYTDTHLCTFDEIKRTYDLKNVSQIANWTGTAWAASGFSKYTGVGVLFVNDCHGFTDSSGSDSFGNAYSFTDNKGLTGSCGSLIPIACCKVW